MKTVKYPLTYFTNSTRDEFVDIIRDLSTILPKDDIVSLFVERFDANYLFTTYDIAVTPKLESSIKKTLDYAIDTEMLIRFIFDTIEETSL